MEDVPDKKWIISWSSRFLCLISLALAARAFERKRGRWILYHWTHKRDKCERDWNHVFHLLLLLLSLSLSLSFLILLYRERKCTRQIQAPGLQLKVVQFVHDQLATINTWENQLTKSLAIVGFHPASQLFDLSIWQDGWSSCKPFSIWPPPCKLDPDRLPIKKKSIVCRSSRFWFLQMKAWVFAEID